MKVFADNIWSIDYTLPMPGADMPARATLVRHPSGKLTLIAPVKMTEETVNEIKILGEVESIVAPNAFHHLYVKAAKRAFPSAKLYCTPALKEKRKDIEWDEELQSGAFNEELECLEIEGTKKFQEFVFFHKPSQSLIVMDSLFNLGKVKGWGQIFYRLFGTYNKTAVSRLFNLLCDDKTKAHQSFQKMMNWPFENIIMAHGTPITTKARETFVTAAKERGIHLQA